jgi:hypothetical protein
MKSKDQATEGLGLTAATADSDKAQRAQARECREKQETLDHTSAPMGKIFEAGLALLAGGFTDWPNLRAQAEACVDMLTAPTADEGTTINDADVEYLSGVDAGDETGTETA